ncbi:hypothetical protein WY02_14545 [Pseudonocardia sp. AL041005-10]|nr:hypothetical protein WY02_14545 [Pseudonocardia sp. AL041005-10]
MFFGMSLFSCLALDLPKLMTRFPPPWALFRNQNSRIRTSASGIIVISSVERKESWRTTVSYSAIPGTWRTWSKI